MPWYNQSLKAIEFIEYSSIMLAAIQFEGKIYRLDDDDSDLIYSIRGFNISPEEVAEIHEIVAERMHDILNRHSKSDVVKIKKNW